jgi:hypothetical protein
MEEVNETDKKQTGLKGWVKFFLTQPVTSLLTHPLTPMKPPKQVT